MGGAANLVPQCDDDTVWPDLLRVVLCGSSIPAAVRPGFSRSWGILAVDDMYASVTPDSIEVRVLLPDGSRELVDGTVMAEIEGGDRLSIRVSLQAPSWLTFEVELLAKQRGRVVLPLTVGPIEVVHTLPRPLLGAQWSRQIALSLGCAAAASDMDDVGSRPKLRVHEAQASTSTIASATWDPGVLLAAYLSHTWHAGTLLRSLGDAEEVGVASGGVGLVAATGGLKASADGSIADGLLRDGAPLRCVELGCGVGIAGLALAAAAAGRVRLALTDGDANAVALAKRNATVNGLGGCATTHELRWGGSVTEVCEAMGGRPHVILMADVIYRHETFRPLVQTIAGLCDAPSSPNSGTGTRRTERGAPLVLLSYRPRVDDGHFWHLLREEFAVEALQAPEALRGPDAASASATATATASARRAVTADNGGAKVGGNGAVSARGSGGRGGGGDDAEAGLLPTAQTRIFRLRRRAVRVPTSCRDCCLRAAVHARMGIPPLDTCAMGQQPLYQALRSVVVPASAR
jgi:hypothetical protein